MGGGADWGTVVSANGLGVSEHRVCGLFCVLLRRPLLLEARGHDAVPMLQTAEQLRRGGDFIPGFVKSGEQVCVRMAAIDPIPSSKRVQQAKPWSSCQCHTHQE